MTYAEKDLVRIPNPDAKKEYVEAAMSMFEIDTSLFGHVKEGIDEMLEKEDISLLCNAFEQGHDIERGVRDTIQGEVSFQEGTFKFIIADIQLYSIVYFSAANLLTK